MFVVACVPWYVICMLYPSSGKLLRVDVTECVFCVLAAPRLSVIVLVQRPAGGSGSRVCTHATQSLTSLSMRQYETLSRDPPHLYPFYAASPPHAQSALPSSRALQALRTAHRT